MIFVNLTLKDGSIRSVNPHLIESISQVDGRGAVTLASGELLVTDLVDADGMCGRERLVNGICGAVQMLTKRIDTREALRQPLPFPLGGRPQ